MSSTVKSFVIATTVAVCCLATTSASLVQIEQFYMAQCPMSSTLLSDFQWRCFENGNGIKDIVNYTINMVGGPNGGFIDSTNDNKSFHGDQEIVAEKFMLCAREMEPNQGLGTYQWLNFTSCMNGYKGIGICTMYLPDEINGQAKTCAEAHGFDWTTLNTCAMGSTGESLYKASEYYTNEEMHKWVATNYTEGTPRYGTAGGKAWGIPIIRIAGVIHKDTPDAYELLGPRICKAAGIINPEKCSCLKA